MQLFNNRLILRLKLNENHYMYWTGKSFAFNIFNAKKYKSAKNSHRVMNAIVKSVLSGLRRVESLGLGRWDDVNGLFEICMLGIDMRGNEIVVPTSYECISWLKGYKSYTNEVTK